MQVTGVCIIKMDGGTLRTKEGATINFGGVERTPQLADGRLIGYSEKPAPATISGTLAHTADTDVEALKNASNVTLVFQCDSGPGYLVREAFLTAPPELTGGEGDLSVEFTGQPSVNV